MYTLTFVINHAEVLSMYKRNRPLSFLQQAKNHKYLKHLIRGTTHMSNKSNIPSYIPAESQDHYLNMTKQRELAEQCLRKNQMDEATKHIEKAKEYFKGISGIGAELHGLFDSLSKLQERIDHQAEESVKIEKVHISWSNDAKQ